MPEQARGMPGTEPEPEPDPEPEPEPEPEPQPEPEPEPEPDPEPEEGKPHELLVDGEPIEFALGDRAGARPPARASADRSPPAGPCSVLSSCIVLYVNLP